MIEEQIPVSDPAIETAILLGQERQAMARAAQYAGYYDDAGIEAEEYFGEMYGALTVAYAEEGDVAAAETYLANHVHQELSSYKDTQAALAGVLAADGKYEEAKEKAASLQTTYYMDRAEAAIVEGMVGRGDINSALAVSRGIELMEPRITAKLKIAEADGPGSAVWKEIKRDVSDVYEGPAKEDVKLVYATALARAGRLHEAADVHDHMRWHTGTRRVEIELAKAEGPESSWWDRLESGFNAARGTPDADGFASDLAIAYAEIGQQEQAMEHVALITQDQESTQLEVLVTLGKYDEALDICWQMRNYDSYYPEAIIAEQRIARELADKGRLQDAERTIEGMYDPAQKAKAYAAVAVTMGRQAKETGVPLEDIHPEEVLEARLPNPASVKHVGAYAMEHWKKFREYDGATFARLAHGAANIANSYMSDDERLEFVRTLGKEFTRFRDEGMFDDGKHQIVLKHLSEALVEAGDPGTTGVMLETLYANMGEATGLRLIKTLVESGNAKAGAAGIGLMAEEDTPNHTYQYLLHKLAATGYLDRKLPEFIVDSQQLGFPAAASRRIFQRYYHELGIQLDSTLLRWTVEQMYENKEELHALRPEGVMDGLDEKIDTVMTRIRESTEKYDGYGQAQLLGLLERSEDDRALYFVLHGGKTQYTLIHHYNFGKFDAGVIKAAEVEQRVRDEYIRTDLWQDAESGWLEAMQVRRRPDESLVWQQEVGSAERELRDSARRETRNVVGGQLQWLLGEGGDAKNFAEMPDRIAPLPAGADKKLAGILGEHLSGILKGEDRDVTIGDFNKVKNGMLVQLRQLRQTARQQKDPAYEKWRSVVERAESQDPVDTLRYVLAIMDKNPDRALHPRGADAEWIGHLAGLSTTVRESQRKGTDNRSLTVRYLDGKEDFAEMLRFADGAQCCFTSEDTVGTLMDPAGEWRTRINRDPHWFVFSIEDTPPDADTRVSSGFVFGSVAEVDGRPALAINGVYMQRKTDSAANAVLEGIVENFAKPMGVRSVVVATKYGGDFAIDKSKWQPGEGHEINRPRAIVDANGLPETQVYDDLGNQVNTPHELDKSTWLRIVRR
jgi:hypothetical protein